MSRVIETGSSSGVRWLEPHLSPRRRFLSLRSFLSSELSFAAFGSRPPGQRGPRRRGQRRVALDLCQVARGTHAQTRLLFLSSPLPSVWLDALSPGPRSTHVQGGRQTCGRGCRLAQALSVGCLRPRASVCDVVVMGLMRREQVTVVGAPLRTVSLRTGREDTAESDRAGRLRGKVTKDTGRGLRWGSPHRGSHRGTLHRVTASCGFGDLCGTEPVTRCSL